MSDRPADPREVDPAESKSPQHVNAFYRLTVLAAVALIVTIFALAVLPVADPNAPVNRWLMRFGGLLIAGEVALCLLFGLVAMAADRRRYVQEQQRDTKK